MRISMDSRPASTDPPSSSLPLLLTLTHVPVQLRGQRCCLCGCTYQRKWSRLKYNPGEKKSYCNPNQFTHPVYHKGKASIKQRDRDSLNAISTERIAQTVQNLITEMYQQNRELGQGHVAWAEMPETSLVAKSQYHVKWNMQITRDLAWDCARDSHHFHPNLDTWL